MSRAFFFSALLALAGCAALSREQPVTAPIGAGCITYGAQRPAMPRPLPDTQLGLYVARLDQAMTTACH